MTSSPRHATCDAHHATCDAHHATCDMTYATVLCVRRGSWKGLRQASPRRPRLAVDRLMLMM